MTLMELYLRIKLRERLIRKTDTTRYMCRWFKTEEEAKVFQKKNGGVLYKNIKRSRTKQDHLIAAIMFGFDPEEFRYSVNWNEFID